MHIKDERVKHPLKSDWGLGRVLENAKGNKVRVFFVNVGEKTIDTSFVQLVTVKGADAAHPVLDNPKLADRSAGKRYKSLPEAKADFLRLFPSGFDGQDYLAKERNYKFEAHKLVLSLLDENEFAKLLKQHDYSEICKRALQVANKTNLIFPNEKMAFKDGLALDDNNKRFSEALFTSLYGKGEMEQRFAAFADCLLYIGAAKWTVATYFLYMRYPKEHMFMKPTVTQNAADLCAFELNYHPTPNWLTYKSLLAFVQYLFKSLKNIALNPRDMIDVQSFMWCIDPNSYQGGT